MGKMQISISRPAGNTEHKLVHMRKTQASVLRVGLWQIFFGANKKNCLLTSTTDSFKSIQLTYSAANHSSVSTQSLERHSVSKRPYTFNASGQQTTLGSSVTVKGTSLHRGEHITVTLRPAKVGEGRYFVRTDQEAGCDADERVSATVHNVCETRLSTSLGKGRSKFQTVEHLLSALEGIGVDNVRVDVEGGAELPGVGRQWYTWSPGSSSSYTDDVAAARTFAILEQVEELRAAGLIKGGSLENALVWSIKSGLVNPPLRFPDEPCRHKLLDLIGDLALCAEAGHPGLPLAHVVAFKAGHDLHVKLGRALLELRKTPQQ